MFGWEGVEETLPFPGNQASQADLTTEKKKKNKDKHEDYI